MKKIVVLGSDGFIGDAVCSALAATDTEYLPVATDSRTLRLDIRFAWLADVLEDADTVYLCAGRTGGVGRMAADPLSFVYPNVRIQMNTMQACAEAGVRRLVFCQSTTGYANSPEPMREDQYLDGPLHPAYAGPGAAGRFIEQVAAMFPQLEIVRFRPSNVYGPGNNFDPQTSHVIEATVRKVAERQDPFVIWGSGKETRDAIYIDDLAAAMVIPCPAGAYNVGTGEEMDIDGIVHALLAHADFSPRIERDESKPTAIMARRVDCTKLRALGWTPQVSMLEGLRKTYDSYQEHR